MYKNANNKVKTKTKEKLKYILSHKIIKNRSVCHLKQMCEALACVLCRCCTLVMHLFLFSMILTH